MNPTLWKLYGRSLTLLPQVFRQQHARQMLQTVRDAHAEHLGAAVTFWAAMFMDLFLSSLRERFIMVEAVFRRRPLVFLALTFACASTFLGGICAVTMQQVLRRGANEPQYDMVRQFSSELASGTKPKEAIPPGYVDAATSLEPFTIFYDEQDVPQAGTGYLDQSKPTPPAGVFDYARQHGMNVLTWQPRRDVRIAVVMKHVSGNNPGFLLAGRSLRNVEQGESLLWWMTLVGWIFLMIATALGVFIGERLPRRAETV